MAFKKSKFKQRDKVIGKSGNYKNKRGVTTSEEYDYFGNRVIDVHWEDDTLDGPVFIDYLDHY